jgi:hypothetical protein
MIKALELVTAHRSSMIQYCETCYSEAVAGFNENSSVTLCKECLQRREDFIARHHTNPPPFLEPWERLWVPGIGYSLTRNQDPSGSKCDVDDDFNNYFLVQKRTIGGDGAGRGAGRAKRPRKLEEAPAIGGKIGPELTSEVVFGVLSAVGIYAGIGVQVYSTRKQMRRKSAADPDIKPGHLRPDAVLAGPSADGA